MEELKDCPFCGGKAKMEESEPSTAHHNYGGVHFAVTCTSKFCLCNCAKFWDLSPGTAAGKWNKRYQAVDKYRAICEPALGEMSLVINDDEYHGTSIYYTFKKLIKDLDKLESEDNNNE